MPRPMPGFIAVICVALLLPVVAPTHADQTVPTLDCRITSVAQSVGATERIAAANAAGLRQLAAVGRSEASGGTHWSPDGRQLAVTADIGVWIYDATDWTAPPKFISSADSLDVSGFSLDGKVLIGQTSDYKIRFIDIATQQTIREFDGLSTWANDIILSPDGKLLIASTSYHEHRVIVWDASSGQVLLDQHTSEDNNSAPDGSAVIAGQRIFYVFNGAVYTWNVDRAKQADKLAEDAISLRLSPDQGTVVVIGQDTLRLFEIATGKLSELSTPGDVIDVEIGDGGKSLLGLFHTPDDMNKRLLGKFDLATGKLKRIGVLPDDNSGGSFSPDGRYIIGLDIARTPELFRLWDAGTGTLRKQFQTGLNGWFGAGSTNVMTFSSDGTKVAVTGANGFQIIELATGKTEATIDTHGFVTLIGMSARNGITWTAASLDRDILHQRNLATGKEATVSLPLSGTGPFMSPVESLLAYDAQGNGNVAVLWDVQKQQVRRRLSVQLAQIDNIVFSPDDHYLLISGLRNSSKAEAQIQLWDVSSGTRIHDWLVAQSSNTAFSPDSGLLAFDTLDSSISIVETRTGKQTIAIPNAHRAVFSGDGHWLAYDVMEGDGAALMNLATKAVDTLRNGTVPVFSPDSHWIVTQDLVSDTHRLNIRNITTGQQLAAFGHGPTPFLEAVFSPDSALVADLVSPDGTATVTLFELATAKPLVTITGCDPVGVQFGPDGHLLALGFHSTIGLWGVGSTS